ncbi:MAG: Dam family site-specific DNA-(adenine-N6)-methyltransferase [Oscillospiraceae bacterium]|jgi:adenine-specific DNA-methyltransferase|nr:Dam family site-specific DNA-(adenine-N6)-methyltransferase [Oscillospiraceae bacterium]
MRFIGGKSQLLSDIENVIIKNTYGNERVFCDIFSGTGSVARYFKPKYEVHANDFLHFSYVLQKATIENNKEPLFKKLVAIGIVNPIKFLEETELLNNGNHETFVADNYAPNDNCNRMYLSKRNAMRIDFIRNTIEVWKNQELIDEIEYYYLLASLIEGVPYISNITGTYGAYLKEWDKRAYKEFEMARLDIINNNKANRSYNVDANKLISELEGDILYIDPPYNSRQYAPNYHLLETISRYDKPVIRGVTGMRPYDDVKSAFCVKSEVHSVFEDLIAKAKFDNIIMSYSTEGLMSTSQIEKTLKRYGIESSYKQYDIPYRKYKSKISNETKELKEFIFYIRKNNPKINYFPIPILAVAEKVPEYHTKRMKYQKSPLNYIGGKFKLLPQIIPLFPRQINTFVDLFAGGCNVSINITAEKIICNDINTKIIDMYRTFHSTDRVDIINHIEKRINEYSLSKENEEGFIAFRNYYNKTQNPIDLYTLTCYSFNYQFRFNNNHEYNNPFGRNRSQFSEGMRNNLILFLEKIKSMNINFTSQDFTEFDISKLNHDDMVYCDPPYLITTGSYNDGNRGFKDWKDKQETALYNLLDNLHKQGVKFALSNVLTHKDIRNEKLIEWCKKYIVTAIENDYSNSCYNAKKGKSLEVLITNY